MAKMGYSKSVASRLAAATALTGTLAACDGRTVGVADTLFGPAAVKAPAPVAQKAPAAPGNPVYIDGSKSANDALYQQTYGAPIQGSGQSIPVPQTFASSVYQDSTIQAAPILDIPGGPVIDAGISTPVTSYTSEPIAYSTEPVTYSSETVAYSEPVVSSEPVAYSVPILTDEVSTSIPTTVEVPLPQFSAPIPASEGTYSVEPEFLPQSALLPTQIFTDASASVDGRDIEPLLDSAPLQSVPYGSSASHRYSAPEQSIAVVPVQVELPQYTAIEETALPTLIEVEPLATEVVTTSIIEPLESGVEVAALGAINFMPFPRARPARIGPVFEEKTIAQAAPRKVVKPAAIRTSPLPLRRPLSAITDAGRAITDAPALTEPPKMIQVEAVFVDDLPEKVQEPAPVIETAALAPLAAEKTMTDAIESAPSVAKAPEVKAKEKAEIKKEIAAVEEPKIDPNTYEEIKETEVASVETPRLEIADDLEDLKELSGTSWRLASLRGKDVPASAELHFDGNSGFAGGQGICNNYGGEFSETLKGEFNMGNIFSTETACKDLRLEKDYIVALETASKYRMAPGLKELMLIGPDGKTLATFAAF